MPQINQTSVSSCRDGHTLEEVMVYHFRAYVSPCLAIIGIPTNILTMIVFGILQYRSPCRFNLYAIWLCPLYNIQLITKCLLDDFFGRGLKWATNCRYWIKFDTVSSFNCKCLTFLSESSALGKAFVLMYFSADRVFSIYWPIRFSVDGTLWYARGGIIVCYLAGFLLNIPQLVFVDRIVDKGGPSCSYMDPVAPGVQYVLYLYIVGATIIPSIFIFVTNVLILVRMWLVMKNSTDRKKLDRQSSNELSKIIAHLVLSVLFELLSFPSVVGIILRQQVYIMNHTETQPAYANQIVQLSKLFSSIDCINYSFEFFIFLIFMPTFRKTLWKLCKCSGDILQSESVEWTNNLSSAERTSADNAAYPNLCSVQEIFDNWEAMDMEITGKTTMKNDAADVTVTRL
ncbi:Somatostatin receptor type 5 [Fasciolopsis buskii]|uniref:Somatostatin receptor type 5 n=1 Tax=Fasciolopsis buskii TaxID=27845 RepID=A0A8E0VP00_9TREM|nr:Somatostatin receptor type 5 [Fasciolopsis buski]